MWKDSLECAARKGMANDMVKQLGITHVEAFNRIDNIDNHIEDTNTGYIHIIFTLIGVSIITYLFIKVY